KWPHHRNLRNRPPTPSKGRGPVQVRIRRAFIASGAEVLSSTQIYDWTHSRRRQSHRKKLPFGVYWRTLKTLRAMCDPIERVPPHGAWLWLAQPCEQLIAVWKNPRKNEFHDFNKTGLFSGAWYGSASQMGRLSYAPSGYPPSCQHHRT